MRLRASTWGLLIAASAVSAELLGPSLAGAQTPVPVPPVAADHVLALTGATVFPVSAPAIENATVVIRGDRIESVGAGIAVPAGAEVVDLTGHFVYPGLIGAHTILGLYEIGSVRQTRDDSEVGRINPNVRAEVAVNPESALLPVARANGILTALTVPSGGLISGTSALIRLDGWTWEEMTIRAPVALHVQWPDLRLDRSATAKPPLEDQVAKRARELDELTDTFARARAYAEGRDAFAARRGPAIERDARWEAMVPVLRGEVPVIVHAQDLHQMTAALDWAQEEGVRLILAGGLDAPLLADRLRAQDVPVIVGGVLARPSRDYEPYDWIYTVAARLHEAGVRFCISSGGDASNERNLPYHAAMAWSYGLPHDRALEAITLSPAQILGVGDQLGSIEAGKLATLIVTDGDPLEITTHVERAFLEGREIPLVSRHTQLYEKYRQRPR